MSTYPQPSAWPKGFPSAPDPKSWIADHQCAQNAFSRIHHNHKGAKPSHERLTSFGKLRGQLSDTGILFMVWEEAAFAPVVFYAGSEAEIKKALVMKSKDVRCSMSMSTDSRCTSNVYARVNKSVIALLVTVEKMRPHLYSRGGGLRARARSSTTQIRASPTRTYSFLGLMLRPWLDLSETGSSRSERKPRTTATIMAHH
ncbi:uncharacterized protein IWZ02DRAFT_280896 [Phyllosticta citriasiana]|uniref:Uncharacterized protein n=1 Tax=Phyllosticta citriasiana TaxID=595635 RepID=A0ABR1KYI4_9PEZI